MKGNRDFRYKMVGSIVNNNPISVFVGVENESSKGEEFLINEFPKSYKYLLKSVFLKNCHNKTILKDFFISGDNFYAVFDYNKGSPIKSKFCEEKNIYTYVQRFDMIQKLLIHIESASYLPLELRLCSLDLNNIVLNSKDEIKINYNLTNISSFNNASTSDLFKAISKIIEIVFEHEIKILKNQYLKMIVEKCEHGLYSNIPEMIVDIKKAKSKPKQNKFMLEIKYFIKKYKPQLLKTAYIGGGCVAAILCIFLIPFLLNQKDTAQYFKIGDVEYNVGLSSSIEIGKIKIEDKAAEVITTELDLSIPSDVYIEFNDYIVKAGDTLNSICEECYSSKSFISTIKSYNNLSSDEDLVPGSIIRVPDETVVKDYFSV